LGQRFNGLDPGKFPHAEPAARRARCAGEYIKDKPMRSGCLFLLGVPLPVILILWLITGHA
jgi:hypothetical protein